MEVSEDPLATHKLIQREDLEDDFLDCTAEDLLRFDDYNNDGYLTLQELYTAFRNIDDTQFALTSLPGCFTVTLDLLGSFGVEKCPGRKD
ncbi:Follistatin-related protein 4 [Varanus komodoensis]|nr:Follistatin-related protein 4 [Varanus komodoensis]